MLSRQPSQSPGPGSDRPAHSIRGQCAFALRDAIMGWFLQLPLWEGRRRREGAAGHEPDSPPERGAETAVLYSPKLGNSDAGREAVLRLPHFL